MRKKKDIYRNKGLRVKLYIITKLLHEIYNFKLRGARTLFTCLVTSQNDSLEESKLIPHWILIFLFLFSFFFQKSYGIYIESSANINIHLYKIILKFMCVSADEKFLNVQSTFHTFRAIPYYGIVPQNTQNTAY